jgi:LacI family transcriptional regulator
MSRAATPNLKDVAAHAGVSISTVSRVINGGPYVTEAVRARVTASMQALGYQPHALAQSLRTGQTQTVGYIVSDIANTLFSTIARGIDDELQRSAYTMFLANSRADALHDLAIIKHMQRRRVDGLILSLSDETHPELREHLRRLDIPVVLLDREVDGLRADRVLVDHLGGVRSAVRHLHAFGHRRIALITAADSTRPGRAIRQAFDAAAAELGLPPAPEDRLIGSFGDAFGAQALAQLLDRASPPTAVLAGGAQITVGVLRAIRARGLRVPGDLSLVAYDDTDVTALFTPAINVIARSVYDIGAQAARLLLERLGGQGRACERVATIPTTLIIRGSVGEPPAAS